MARGEARSWWLPFVVGFLTVAASVFLWQRLVRQESAEIRGMAQSQALFAKNKTEAEMTSRILPLERLARRWEIRGAPAEIEWESDAALVMSGTRGYQAIEWVDPTFHVRWVAPRRGNETDLDLDLGAEPRLRAVLEAAEDTRRVMATRPVELRQGGRGFLVCVPVYPENKFGGLLVGVFRYQELLYSILEDVAQDYWVAVYEGEEQIYNRAGASTPEEEHWAEQAPIRLAQLAWRVRVWPKAETLAHAHSPLPRVALLGGLFMAMLLAFAVHQAQTALFRARAVAATNVELKREMAERKQVEEALRRSEEKYRSLVEGAPYGIAWSTLDGRLVMANRAMVELLGYSSAEELQAVNMVRDVYQDPAERARLIEQYQNQESFEGVEVRWKRKDGKPIIAQLSGRKVRDVAGELVGFEVMIEDVTRRRVLEEQLRQAQKLEAVGRLAGGLAHDFNNLLMVIRGHTDLLLASLAPGDPLRRCPEDILKAAERAAWLTRQLLAFGRKQVLKPKVIDLNNLVVQVAELLPPLLGPEIDLVLALAPDAGRVSADPAQMEQVLLNLVVNARDAMPDGGELTVQTSNVLLDAASARPGPLAKLAVSDTGRGMDAEARAHLFEPFFSTKEKDRRSGLGLASVYGTVEQSGGTIRVQSEVGQGTTIEILLPRVEEAAEPLALRKAPARSLQGTETILVVEDDDGVRKLTREFLKIRGYTVLEARSAADALRVAERHAGPIHLLLTDVVMPEVNGRELAGQLVGARPEIKVLYMSAYTEDAIAHFGMLDPGTALIEKPFSPDELAGKVREVLEAPTPA